MRNGRVWNDGLWTSFIRFIMYFNRADIDSEWVLWSSPHKKWKCTCSSYIHVSNLLLAVSRSFADLKSKGVLSNSVKCFQRPDPSCWCELKRFFLCLVCINYFLFLIYTFELSTNCLGSRSWSNLWHCWQSRVLIHVDHSKVFNAFISHELTYHCHREYFCVRRFSIKEKQPFLA